MNLPRTEYVDCLSEFCKGKGAPCGETCARSIKVHSNDYRGLPVYVPFSPGNIAAAYERTMPPQDTCSPLSYEASGFVPNPRVLTLFDMSAWTP